MQKSFYRMDIQILGVSLAVYNMRLSMHSCVKHMIVANRTERSCKNEHGCNEESVVWFYENQGM